MDIVCTVNLQTHDARHSAATTFSTYTSMYCRFLETGVACRCMVSRGVWRLSGSFCGAFGDAIVCVNAATSFKYIVGGLKGWTAYDTYAATSITN